MLDDCTGDMAAAADIVWWAAVGKTWIATLDREKLAYRRCTETEAEVLRAENEHSVLPCEWEGELLGYLCVEKKTAINTSQRKKEKEESGKRKRMRRKSALPRNAFENISPPSKASLADAPLATLGPQAMGLLAAGVDFGPQETAEPDLHDPAEENKKWTKKESKVDPDAQSNSGSFG
jgi:hypothetical protein